MSERPVLAEDLTGDREGVRVIRVNRPTKRNALNLETKSLLVTELERADADPTVGAIVLTGESATALAAQLMAQPPLNVRAVRKIARHAEAAPLHTAIELERTTFQLLFDTADHAEGIAAFLDRRTPTYEGN